MAPGLIMAASMAVEVGAWATAQISTQRAADLSAIAGATYYQSSNNAQNAATLGARIAQLNGHQGTTSPAWSGSCTTPCTTPCTATLTDNQVTAQVILCSGWTKTSDPMLRVSVQTPIASTLSAVFSTISTHTVTATGTAELVTTTTAATGAAAGQPCILTLSTSSYDITASGTASLTATDCTVVSNSNISASGNVSISDLATFEAGSNNSTSGHPSFTPAPTFNSGVLPDPYATNAAVQTAIGQLSSGGTTVSLSGGTQTISPGTYASWSLSGQSKLILNPGLYIVNGSISGSGGSTIDASSGVTIVMSGSFSYSGNGGLTMTAPNHTSNGGVVPGMALISTGSSVSLSGTSAITLTGVFYAPRAALSLSGTSMASTNCEEFIINTVSVSGTPSLTSSGCPGMGALTFASTSGTTTTTARIVH